MNIQKQRELLQGLLVSGKLDSLSVQVIALNSFARNMGWSPVDNDIRKGFYCVFSTGQKYKSLMNMQRLYNAKIHNHSVHLCALNNKFVQRISLQYCKRTTKKLKTELQWLKFLGKEE